MSDAILLIVNADDFGLAASVNRAVAQAFDVGIVRSATWLAGGDAAEEAARLALARPGLGVGVHLALTQVRAVLGPQRLGRLVGDAGQLPPTPKALLRKLIAGRISPEVIAAEFRAQVEKALDLGLKVSHLDGHQHLHLLPSVREAFMDTARHFRLRRMRLPRNGGPSRDAREWAKALAVDAMARGAAAAFSGMRSPDAFWGLACSGDLNRHRLLAILRELPPGAHELMTHPADSDAEMRTRHRWRYHWEAEFQALCDWHAGALIRARGIRLGSYHDLPLD